ncbi:SDR family NAD(P)-dependent oxidoreductase [Micromonospora sp. WMMD1102]|uniref:SDR family NAD(P)-dependent oxidoreductase n=1 Tax=Micromonospora sp. WMMD1102 TaxID=3016105 RepID=UPI0024159418|nr:SDR family oxidoreductase [Micromonospora sp. WMMD1102]MDG4788204.1 SDR family NAD(P)-dependent oxidoreductase [Micromonospora sp. WMMD1102]
MPDATAGRPVLVTGASRGIGAAIAHRFAAAGDRVAVHHSGTGARAAEPHAELPGVGHVSVVADLRDADAVLRMVDEAADALGGLAVLVNNAGVFGTHPIHETGYPGWRRAWRETLDVNLLGAVNTTWAAVRHLQAGGRIVNVSSVSAFRGEWSAAAYAASKAGLNSFTQSMAVALGLRGIAVAAVAPGWVETDMTRDVLASPVGAAMRARSPFDRVGRPAEVADAVHYLASPAAEWCSGAVLDLNGASHAR